jgi:hypothetical protein
VLQCSGIRKLDLLLNIHKNTQVHGVMASNRLSGAAPQYPTIAKSVQGAVVLAPSTLENRRHGEPSRC